MTAAVAYPVPASPLDEYLASGLPPADLDPTAEGILMAHQVSWIEDDAWLKLCAKGRRTGITFSEAFDQVLIASARRSAGGDNCFYIGDTKEKGREFIETCALFAKFVVGSLPEIGEFLFEYADERGDTKEIQAFRIRFASGFAITALSSRPAAIRGLQGVVCIDEAAFHLNVRAVIDACNALVIWGGRIRIISTHNGDLNAFNELVKETREGKWDYSLHQYTFDDAVAGGLYERVCMRNGWTPSAEGKAEWYRRVRGTYGTRTAAMREELDAIPREGSDIAVPLAWIEAAARPEHKVVDWSPPSETFVDRPEAERTEHMARWLEEEVRPHVAPLIGQDLYVGGDFALRQDRSFFAAGYVGKSLERIVPLALQLTRCPYAQQKQALFWLIETVGNLRFMILDANGNGMVLAQEARQHPAVGPSRILELIANDAWYREHGPPFRAAFEDRTIEIPADRDLRDDIRQLRDAGGVIKIPRDVRKEGSDGGKRHGDGAVALQLFHAATRMEGAPAAGASVDPAPDIYVPERAARSRLVERPVAAVRGGAGPRNRRYIGGI